MKIIVNHNFCQVEESSHALDSLLSYKTKDYLGYGKNKKFVFSTVSLVQEDQFFTGLLPRVIAKFHPEIVDERLFEPITFEVPMLTEELRDYQYKYLFDALRLSRCLIKAPTGSGKTLMIAATIAAMNKNTILLAPGVDICTQLTAEMKRLLPQYFSVSNKIEDDPAVLVTLPGRLKKVKREVLYKYPVLCMDEAHTSAAAGATDVILRIAAPYRFGFTATPTGRSDNRDLVVEGLFGEIIEAVDHEELVDQGFLPDTKIEIYGNGFDGDFVEMENLLIVQNPVRNQKIIDLVAEHVRTAKDEVALVLVRRTEHGRFLAQHISESVYLDGESSVAIREETKEEAKKGNIRVIIATQIFAQGIDIPNITLCINAGGGKSSIITGQRFGRVTRMYGGAVKRYVDFYDTLNRTMENHSKDRLEIYRERTSNIRLRDFSDSKKEEIEMDFRL